MSADAAMEWVFVPREPTEAQIQDGARAYEAVLDEIEPFKQGRYLSAALAAYRAMLAAAPPAPAADARDAARYRWLRTEQDDGGTEDFPTSGLGVSQWTALPVWDDNILKGDELDDAIDAAISAQAAAGEGKL